MVPTAPFLPADIEGFVCIALDVVDWRSHGAHDAHDSDDGDGCEMHGFLRRLDFRVRCLLFV